MDNYVQEMWREQSLREPGKGKRVFAWVFGVAIVVSAAALMSQSYWYPYVSPYL